jgi:hypothetical protein
MPFRLRLYRRFPVQGAVTYNAGPFFLQAAAGLLFGVRVTHHGYFGRTDTTVDGLQKEGLAWRRNG